MLKKQDESLSKIERRRQARDKRVDALRAKDGTKKAIRTGSRLGRILLPIVAVLLLLFVFAWLGFSTGFVQRHLHPISIGKQKVSMAEFNFQYSVNKAQFDNFVKQGWLPGGADGKLDLSQVAELPDAKGMTWGDYLLSVSKKNLQRLYLLNDRADKAGYELSDEDKNRVLTALNKEKETAGENYAAYLRKTYGPGVGEAELKAYQLKALRAQRYSEKAPLDLELEDDTLTSYYEEHKNELDCYNFRSLSMSPAPSATPAAKSDATAAEASEEEKKEAEAAKKAAEEAAAKDLEALAAATLERISTEEDFRTETQAYLAGANSAADSEDPSLSTALAYGRLSARVGQEGQTWLADSARKAGDKTLVSNGKDKVLLMFLGRQRPENELPSVRHILLNAENDAEKAAEGGNKAGGTDEKAATADLSAEAEAIRAEIRSEADMIAKAKELDEAGKLREGARYDNVLPGTMVPAFNDWIFNTARKPGDTGVVKTEYGYHVLYFVAWSGEAQWHFQARQGLGRERFKADMDAALATDDYAISDHGFALRFVNS